MVEPMRRTVVLADGVYEEAVVVSGDVDSVVVGGDGAILERPTAGPVIRVRDGVSIRLERITMQGASGSNGHGVYCTGTAERATDLEMIGVVIRDNAANGIVAVGCGLYIAGSVIEDNAGMGVAVSGGPVATYLSANWVRRNAKGGVDLDSSLYVIGNLLIADNGNPDDAQVGGIVFHQSGLEGAGEVRHLTVARNQIAPASDRNPGIHCLETPTLLTNTIVWDNLGDSPQIGTACSPRYTLVSPGPVPTGLETFEGDPAFVDADGGDYDLGPDSEAIDRGDPADATSLDIHGDPRGENGMADLGADEYVP
jgi:hypothetical protein